jgi:prolyl oligopeptidase
MEMNCILRFTENSPIVTIVDNSDNNIIDSEGSKLFIETDLNAPNKRIVTVDAANPSPSNWVDFIPETENVLSPSTGAGFFFANYMKDAVSVVKQYDYNGKLIREIQLPAVGTVGGFGGKEKRKYYSFTNYTTPGTIYFEPKAGKSGFMHSQKWTLKAMI